MNVDQAALDQAAHLCQKAGREAQFAGQQLHYGNVEAARARLTSAVEASQTGLRTLLDAGARVKGIPAAAPADPLRALALADTPATRRLLDLLREATAAAEEVDAERGNVLPPDVPLQPGESRGTGWAETISNLAERLRVEIEGPRAGGRE
jgi:hypothetical protein